MKLADTVIEKDWDRDKGFVCGCLHQLNKPFFSCFLQRSKKHRFRAWMISGIKEKAIAFQISFPSIAERSAFNY